MVSLKLLGNTVNGLMRVDHPGAGETSHNKARDTRLKQDNAFSPSTVESVDTQMQDRDSIPAPKLAVQRIARRKGSRLRSEARFADDG